MIRSWRNPASLKVWEGERPTNFAARISPWQRICCWRWMVRKPRRISVRSEDVVWVSAAAQLVLQLSPLSSRHERQPLEQVHVLLVFDQCAGERRHELLRVALA